MTKQTMIFRVLLGGVLAYTGIDLVKSALMEKPENYILFTLIGLVFTVIGAGWLITGYLKYRKNPIDPMAEEEEEEETDSEEEAAPRIEADADDNNEDEDSGESDCIEEEAGKEE